MAGREHEGAREEAAARLQAIADEILGHLPCPSEPCATAQHLVPGAGHPQADVVIVGEAPGASEDKVGLPFVGRAGRLLDELLEAADLQREDVFITNVVKARPPGNRDPKARRGPPPLALARGPARGPAARAARPARAATRSAASPIPPTRSPPSTGGPRARRPAPVPALPPRRRPALAAAARRAVRGRPQARRGGPRPGRRAPVSTARTAVMGDWPGPIRDPIDLLRLGLVVATVVALASGNLRGAGYLGIGALFAWAVRPVLPAPGPRPGLRPRPLGPGRGGGARPLRHLRVVRPVVHVVVPMLGAPVAYVALARAEVLPDPRDDTGLHRRRGIFIVTVALGVAIGGLWEIAEWAADGTLGLQPLGEQRRHRGRPHRRHHGIVHRRGACSCCGP
jgi:hypothetical protein